MIDTQKYVRKPLYVDAVRVTLENFDEVAAWCQGEVLQDEVPGSGTRKQYIKVRVHNPKNPRQTKAFVGDWLLYTERGYKVYTNKAFHASFDLSMPFDKAVEKLQTEVHSSQPNQKTGIQPIHQVSAPQDTMAAAVATIEAEGGTVEVATPQAIADVVKEQQPTVEASEGVEVADSPTAPPVEVDGKRVLSLEEQQAMTQTEIRELIQSGEVILAQDLAA
jgi:hypothetical protein